MIDISSLGMSVERMSAGQVSLGGGRLYATPVCARLLMRGALLVWVALSSSPGSAPAQDEAACAPPPERLSSVVLLPRRHHCFVMHRSSERVVIDRWTVGKFAEAEEVEGRAGLARQVLREATGSIEVPEDSEFCATSTGGGPPLVWVHEERSGDVVRYSIDEESLEFGQGRVVARCDREVLWMRFEVLERISREVGVLVACGADAIARIMITSSASADLVEGPVIQVIRDTAGVLVAPCVAMFSAEPADVAVAWLDVVRQRVVAGRVLDGRFTEMWERDSVSGAGLDLGGESGLEACPDADGDGIDDLVLFAPASLASEAAERIGLVCMLSGADGTILWSQRPPYDSGWEPSFGRQRATNSSRQAVYVSGLWREGAQSLYRFSWAVNGSRLDGAWAIHMRKPNRLRGLAACGSLLWILSEGSFGFDDWHMGIVDVGD